MCHWLSRIPHLLLQPCAADPLLRHLSLSPDPPPFPDEGLLWGSASTENANPAIKSAAAGAAVVVCDRNQP
ncbi:hypothetical protein L2E82_36478 [Cichorium intybus]|uniref:Uncharacterized protein n=1 Tax=Cichorium intybus TaxID=13427 RepID=A0ACB9BRS3_CICIN|nr:hypothetical protein L2E82_36478 [Cichorium intybus]